MPKKCPACKTRARAAGRRGRDAVSEPRVSGAGRRAPHPLRRPRRDGHRAPRREDGVGARRARAHRRSGRHLRARPPSRSRRSRASRTSRSRTCSMRSRARSSVRSTGSSTASASSTSARPARARSPTCSARSTRSRRRPSEEIAAVEGIGPGHRQRPCASSSTGRRPKELIEQAPTRPVCGWPRSARKRTGPLVGKTFVITGHARALVARRGEGRDRGARREGDVERVEEDRLPRRRRGARARSSTRRTSSASRSSTRRDFAEAARLDSLAHGHLSTEEVEHVARLARLELTDDEIELFRGQLSRRPRASGAHPGARSGRRAADRAPGRAHERVARRRRGPVRRTPTRSSTTRR